MKTGMIHKGRPGKLLLCLLLTLCMVAGIPAVMMPAAAATDVVFITNGGRQLYFPGSTYMMKGRIANEGVGIPGVSVLIQARLDDAAPFFTAAPETDEEGFFITGFNIPKDAQIGSVMHISMNGTDKASYEIRDMEETVASDPNLALNLEGYTVGAVGQTGSVGNRTINSGIDQFGLVFTRNVNFFVNNNISPEFTDHNILGRNYRNEDCFTLYEGETGDQEVGCTVELLDEGGLDPVSFLLTGGAAGQTTSRNVVYVKPSSGLKADTVYRLVIDEMLTGNNNIHLDDSITVYYKTAADAGSSGGTGSSGNSGGGSSAGGGNGAGGGSGAVPGGSTGGNSSTDPGTSGTGTDPSVQPDPPVVRAVDLFDDVEAGSWYEEAVDYAVAHRLFNGTGERTFSPSESMTRGMLMTVLARMSGLDTSGSDPWYQAGLDWAVRKGVSDGSSPEQAITREQLATMLYRYAQTPAVTGSLGRFTDRGLASSWARDALIWATNAGIIRGNGDTTTLDPQGMATRAQVATMIMRFSILYE